MVVLYNFMLHSVIPIMSFKLLIIALFMLIMPFVLLIINLFLLMVP